MQIKKPRYLTIKFMIKYRGRKYYFLAVPPAIFTFQFLSHKHARVVPCSLLSKKACSLRLSLPNEQSVYWAVSNSTTISLTYLRILVKLLYLSQSNFYFTSNMRDFSHPSWMKTHFYTSHMVQSHDITTYFVFCFAIKHNFLQFTTVWIQIN